MCRAHNLGLGWRQRNPWLHCEHLLLLKIYVYLNCQAITFEFVGMVIFFGWYPTSYKVFIIMVWLAGQVLMQHQHHHHVSVLFVCIEVCVQKVYSKSPFYILSSILFFFSSVILLNMNYMLIFNSDKSNQTHPKLS